LCIDQGSSYIAAFCRFLVSVLCEGLPDSSKALSSLGKESIKQCHSLVLDIYIAFLGETTKPNQTNIRDWDNAGVLGDAACGEG
jgi:hypothetical protein